MPRTRAVRAHRGSKPESPQTPPAGKNTVIVTHYPNIVEVYPEGANALAEGEALILHPDGRGAGPDRGTREDR